MPLNRPLILCVSDDDSRLETRRNLLEKHGYRVLATADLKEGLDLLVRDEIDLVLLDGEMRAINGDPVAASMKAIKPNIPVLLLSARRLPRHKPAFVDAFLFAEEPWANVLARLDELLAPDLPFFAQWLGDWKRRRATVTLEEPIHETPTNRPAKRSA